MMTLARVDLPDPDGPMTGLPCRQVEVDVGEDGMGPAGRWR